MTDTEKLSMFVDYFKEEIQEFIDDNWDDQGWGEKGMGPDEASCFLGYDVSYKTQEEIDEAVNEIQREYYVCGECSNEELIDRFLEMIEEG